ncbi:MAG: hypothetical protein Q4E09_00085 [Eubacteriales bacterium]|nr:hypothetical protein [Eubacteriales bacterium]
MAKKDFYFILSLVILVLCVLNFILNLGKGNVLSLITTGAAIFAILLIVIKEWKERKQG